MKIPIQSHMLFSLQNLTHATCYLIELCQIIVTLSEIHFMLPWSRSRTHFHHICFYTRSKQNFIHPQNKTPSPCMTPLSQNYVKDMRLWENKRCIPKESMPHASACQKNENKIKDAYLKKVCHMLRHVKKKWRDSPLSKKKKKERWCIQRSSYTIHQKYPHTCTSWSRFMTCFSFGSGLWLSKIWEAGMPSNPPYLQLHKNNH